MVAANMAKLDARYDYEWTGLNYERKEVAGPFHAWFAPFYHAVESGTVVHSLPHSSGSTTVGEVSENPESDSTA